ncbi:MAG: glycoside hydrolase family 5 protein, partial [Chitinispirillaceae bacterium]
NHQGKRLSEMRIKLLSALITLIALSQTIAGGKTPVQIHGQLRVEGNKIVDQHGDPTQLRGMSFFWSQWQGQYYNKRAVNWLVKDWKVTVVRAAMGAKHVESESGYMYDGSEKYKVRAVVDAAIKNGIYVIIDWHDHYAHENADAAQSFFEEMARRYGEHPNVIYEIFNEPIKASWSEVVKPYSERIVSAIRKIDPDNLIVIGTPHWCQDVDEAAKDPLEGENLAYSLHFYAATHGLDIQEKAQFAIDKGLALFVTEFGTCLASGDGYLDSLGTEQWFEFMDKHKLSWCNWSIADKDETASALVPGARWFGRWDYGDLTRSGRLIRAKLRKYAGFEENLKPPKKKEKKKPWFQVKPLR